MGTGIRFRAWSIAHHRLLLGAAALYTGILQALASLPDPAAQPSRNRVVRSLGSALFTVPVGWRDIAHIPVYALLGVMWLWAFDSRPGSQRPATLRSAAVVAALIGTATELSQLPMTTRVFSLRDLSSNVLSALAGVLLTAALTRHLCDVSPNPSLQRTSPGRSPGFGR